MSNAATNVMLTAAAFFSGALAASTGVWGYGVIGILMVVTVGALTFVAQYQGTLTGCQAVSGHLELHQLVSYAHQQGMLHAVTNGNVAVEPVKVFIGAERLFPATGVFHAILDGSRAVIIESEIPHGQD